MRFFGTALVISLTALLALVVSGSAQHRSPLGRAAAPPPTWARSVEILDSGTPVVRAPEEGADRRGTIREGTRLPLVGRVGGEGCSTGFWFQVGDSLFVCERHARPSPEEPHGEAIPAVPPGRLLPRRYAFVRFDGTLVYDRPSDYFFDHYVESVGEGFGLIITGHRDHRGVRFHRTRRGLWVTERSIAFARGSDFHGVRIEEDAPLDVAWVGARGAVIRERPRGPVVRRVGRRTLLHVEREQGRYAVLRSGGVVRLASVSRARRRSPPEGVRAEERWIDVDVEEQVLVAYEGERPVFATLVSTGRDRPATATPRGTFRIWAKLAFSDMDNLGDEDARRTYAIAGVPWVQYFEGAYGLHAAFWHDEFGRARSHGCVNLSPRDARTLFEFTRPALPRGWEAILPEEEDRATIVHVH